MSTETEVQEVPEAQESTPVEAQKVSQEVQEQSDDEALQAGFNAAKGIEEPPVVEPEPPKFAGYTEDQIKELVSTVDALKQRESKIFGSMGALKQTIEALKSQPSKQQSVQWSADKLKRMSAEFPELAAILAEDLNGMTVSSGSPDIEQLIDSRVKSSLDKSSQAYEAKLLTVQHRDWRQVVASDDFVGWKESLPPEEKAELDSSWDAEFIGSKLSQYKDWKAKATQSKQTNQRRLEAAITPKGGASGKPAISETDAFLAGFKSVRG